MPYPIRRFEAYSALQRIISAVSAFILEVSLIIKRYIRFLCTLDHQGDKV